MEISDWFFDRRGISWDYSIFLHLRLHTMIQYDYTMPLSSVNLNWMKETPDQYLFFDIETTGLSAARSDLYLIGYGTILNDEQFRITLLFNDDGCSEPKMLAAFKDILADYKYLVTYNGDTFDLPYIKEKYRPVPVRRYPRFNYQYRCLSENKKI